VETAVASSLFSVNDKDEEELAAIFEYAQLHRHPDVEADEIGRDSCIEVVHRFANSTSSKCVTEVNHL
jgi:hypothetical protein